MKYLFLLPVLALPLSGCASVVDGINNISTALTSPATTQALANLKAGAAAFVCAVQSVDAIAGDIATQAKAGKAAVRTTTTIYTTSSILCSALRGTVVGTELVPAAALQ